MEFGPFLFGVLKDLGISADELAEMIGVHERSVYRWRTLKAPPRGEAVVLVADALKIPLTTFRTALEGKAPLPAEYRDRQKWRTRRGVTGGDVNETRGRVWDWYKSAPLAVQHAVLDVVPEGMEGEYLKHVNAYFKARLTSAGKSKRAG
jgi:transcriptional regulator with XRE-family HTH domain